jgi:hypothetical protein
MNIFWRLVLAHFIADFTLQSNKIASWKRESRWGMIVHILTHPIVSIAFVWPYLNWTWVRTPWFSLNGWVCVILIALFHWLEDEWRVWSIQETGSPDSTGFFLWDQAVHLTIILAVSPTIPTAHPERWVFLTLGVALLAHFVSVLIYFLENDKWGESHVLNSGKYGYMFERFVVAGLFVLPGPWIILGVLWLAWLIYRHTQDTDGKTWVHMAVGMTSAVLVGLVTRTFLL